MGATRWDIVQEQGSWEPSYIELRDPTAPGTEKPLLDLTAGFTARMVVASRSDGLGTVLAELDDTSGLRLTATGRLYFEPTPTVTSGWEWRRGWHQIELVHPSVELPVRVAQGRITVSPELVLP